MGNRRSRLRLGGGGTEHGPCGSGGGGHKELDPRWTLRHVHTQSLWVAPTQMCRCCGIRWQFKKRCQGATDASTFYFVYYPSHLVM